MHNPNRYSIDQATAAMRQIDANFDGRASKLELFNALKYLMSNNNQIGQTGQTGAYGTNNSSYTSSSYTSNNNLNSTNPQSYNQGTNYNQQGTSYNQQGTSLNQQGNLNQGSNYSQGSNYNQQQQDGYNTINQSIAAYQQGQTVTYGQPGLSNNQVTGSAYQQG